MIKCDHFTCHACSRPAPAIPESAMESLVRYRDHRCPVGGCLEAVLSNDLFGAMGRADLDYQRGMAAIVKFIYNELPTGAYGSKEAYYRWIANGNG